MLGVKHVVRHSLNCSFKRTCYKKGWRQIYYHFLWRMSGHESPSIMMPCSGEEKKNKSYLWHFEKFQLRQKRAMQEAQLWICGSFLCLQRRTSLCSFSQTNRDSNLERRNISHQVSAHFINHPSLQWYPHCVPKGAVLIKDPVCCQRKTEGKQTEFKTLGCPL